VDGDRDATVRFIRGSKGERADVCVIGADSPGSRRRCNLAEGGASVVVLEAGLVGSGASGRNGGQVIPGLKLDPSELESEFGAERGARLTELVGGARISSSAWCAATRIGVRCPSGRLDQGVPTRSRRFVRRVTPPVTGAGVAPRWKRSTASGSRSSPGPTRTSAASSITAAGSCSRSATREVSRGRAAGGGTHFTSARCRNAAAERRPVDRVHATGSVRADRVIIGTNGYTDLAGAQGPCRGSPVP